MITALGVKRFALVVALAVCTLAASAAQAQKKTSTDLVVFDAFFGGTVSRFVGTRKWQPSLWLDGSYGVAGPLHLGGYFQWLGRSFPLDNPGFGGGGEIALRGNVKKVRLSGAFTGGYLGVPLPERVQGTGTIGAFASLGYGLLSWIGIEVRGRWLRYFRMPDGAPNQSWTIEAGLSFFIE